MRSRSWGHLAGTLVLKHLHPFRRSRLLPITLLAQAWLLSAESAHADNPIVQNVYTADPAPVVYGDTVYLCTSHDEDVTLNNFFTMNDWRLFSSKDMVNWTDHGSPLSYKTFSWATGKAWAPHCISRNGKFYMFVPVSDAIGVAVADSPTGPFVDAIGKPLVSNYQYIDPTVYIDGDDQAYLYFGNPKLWYVKLNTNMISYSGQIQEAPMTTASFGERTGVADRPTLYEEGPWFYERNSLYYMMYAMGPLPEKIGYSTGPSATGPWTYKGVIMTNQSGHAFTNHAGVIDFKGHSYFFYHTQELPGGGGYKRSVAVEEFTYEADGSFPTINKTSAGVTQSVAPLNPYERVEGETLAWAPGIEVEDCSEGGRDVTAIENNDSIKVRTVDFSTGAVSFAARVASGGAGGTIELHLDSATGTLLGTCTVPGTGGARKWQTVTCNVTGATGTHDLYLVFKGGSGALFNLNYWQFTPKDPISTGGTGGTGNIGGGSSLASGGTAATAGASNGGTFATGGKASSGGVTSTGGTVATGGRSATGGMGSVGGATGGATASNAGGATARGTGSGGHQASGGSPSSTGGAANGTGGTSTRRGDSANNATGGALSATEGSRTAVSTAGTTRTANDATSEENSGCACKTTSGRSSSSPWALGLLGAFVTFASLRRNLRRAPSARTR